MKLSSVFSYADIVDMRNEGLNDDEIIQRAKQKVAYQNSPEYEAAKRLDDFHKNELKQAFDSGAKGATIDALRARQNIQKARLIGGTSADELQDAANFAGKLQEQAIKQERYKDANALKRYYYGGVENVNGMIAGLAKIPMKAAEVLDKRINQYQKNIAQGKETETHAKNLASKVGGFLADSWRSEMFKNLYNNANDIAKDYKAKNEAWEQERPDEWNISRLAGEFVNDPLNLVGGKLIAQGAKQGFKKLGANALEGAAIGGVMSVPHASYHSENLSDFAKGVGLGAGIGAVVQPSLVWAGDKIANRAAKKIANENGLNSNTEPNSSTQNSSAQNTTPNTQNSSTDDLATNGVWLDYGNTAPPSGGGLPVTSEQAKAMRESDELGLLRGDNFVTDQKSAKQMSDYGVNVSVEDWVKELGELNNNELSANLFVLQQKHPEFFQKPSDVYRTILEIKNNPTHFFKNNRPDMALIAKRLEDNSLGKIGIVKDSGKIGHLSKSTRDNELARLQRINTEQLQAGSPYPAPVSSNKLPQHGDGASALSGADESILPQRPLNTADTIDLVPDKNGVYQVAYNGSSKELAKIATEIAKGEPVSNGAKRLVYIADNLAETAAKDAEKKISANIAKIDDDSVELYANNTALLADIAKKYPMLSKDEQIELANKQILANASAELIEYSKFLNGGKLPNDARLLGKNLGRMILKSLNAGASKQEIIDMLLKAGISGRNSTAAKALIQTGDINAYNAVMRGGEAELIAELSQNVRTAAKNESLGAILDSAKAKALENDELLKKGVGNQGLDDVINTFKSSKSGKEFEVAENGFGRELLSYDGVAANEEMKRAFLAWEAQEKKADIVLNDGRKVVFLEPDEAVQLSYGNSYLYGEKDFEALFARRNTESLEQKLERLQSHPAYENLLKMRENTKASELKGDTFGGSKPTVFYEPQSERYLRTQGGGGLPNAERSITITKADVAKLRSGKADKALAIKLENNLDALTGDPAASGVLDDLLTRDYHLASAAKKSELVAPQITKEVDIKTDKKAELENFRKSLERKNGITPIKEFGTNYAEFYHDGGNAIKKLLAEKQGQVAGAFYKDGLGDIDLVWGNEKMGLAHILARRSEQWGEEKAIRFINHLAENIEKGSINVGKNGRAQINTELTTIVIDKNKDNRFILTAYRDRNNKMSLGNAKLVQSSTITDKGIETNAKDSSILLSNQQPNSTPKEIKSQGGGGLKRGFSTQALNELMLGLGSGGVNAMAEDDPNKKAEAFIKGFLAGFGGAKAASMLAKNAPKLAPQLARASEKMASDLPRLLNDRPDILGGVLGRMNNAKDKFSFIFGGEKALGANKAKLKVARDMAKSGAKDDEIWAKTGWYKDIDGKWKFEINPNGGELNKSAFDNHMAKEKAIEKEISELEKTIDDWENTTAKERVEAREKIDELTQSKNKLSIKLGDFLDDEALYKAYPQFKDTTIKFTSIDGDLGTSFGGKILLNKNMDIAQMKSVLYHELQHEVQYVEDFGVGGTGYFDKAKIKELVEKHQNDTQLKQLYDEIENGWAVDENNAFNVYQKLAGEAEARNVQTRQAMLEKADKEAGRIISMIKDPQKAMRISKDLANVDEYVMLKAGNKAAGAEHIKLRHTSDHNKTGYVSDDEISRLGENMRKFLLKHKEPYFDKTNNTFVYEWVENGTAFRLITNSRSLSGPDIFNPTSKTLRAPATDSRSLQLAPFNHTGTPAKDEIITFFSNRNLKTNGAYKFTNPEMTWQNATLPNSQLPHPDKTLDIAPNERIVSYDGGVSASVELEKRFLDKNGMLDFNALRAEASELPAKKSLNELRNELDSVAKSSDGKGNYIIETPAVDISIYANYAKGHTEAKGKYGNGKENRSYASGAIVPTLKEPLFVTKRGEALHFYKAFKNENGGLDIISVSRNINGKLEYRTIYKNEKYFKDGKSTSDLMEMIKNDELVYLKDADAKMGASADNSLASGRTSANSQQIRNHFTSKNSTPNEIKSQELEIAQSFSPELKASYDMRDKLLKSTNEVRASLNEKGKAELEKLAGSKDSKLSRDAQIMKTLENAKSNPTRYEKLKKLYLDENGKVKDSIGLC